MSTGGINSFESAAKAAAPNSGCRLALTRSSGYGCISPRLAIPAQMTRFGGLR